ncbi:hypothetical protein ACPPVO_53885 [Dactylosporangium sp. McL0621]|uniref:hypothetical protein n=1 Tax=Dactylosporangium sp. McL0621 TaxID=3415678 RepID=UPI003CEF79DB
MAVACFAVATVALVVAAGAVLVGAVRGVPGPRTADARPGRAPVLLARAWQRVAAAAALTLAVLVLCGPDGPA